MHILKAKPSGRVVAYHASTPHVRDSNPGLGKVDLAFHPFSWTINEYQACLGLNTGGFTSNCPPDRNICPCTSASKVTKSEMSTVDLNPHGMLRN
ncbi:hypothetical protein TNCV_399881 [Trichonephila clavipes]|nr:hypothetical protein TNCV_399881 [Trichonephila clavipes]